MTEHITSVTAKAKIKSKPKATMESVQTPKSVKPSQEMEAFTQLGNDIAAALEKAQKFSSDIKGHLDKLSSD